MEIIEIKTKGHYDFINITDKIDCTVERSGLKEGLVVVFVCGSTASLIVAEDEKGIFRDIKNVLEKIIPEDDDYEHHKKWGDRNGAAHIKSALFGTDLVVPVENGKLRLGTWQQIILIDFDEKPRTREVTVQIIEIK